MNFAYIKLNSKEHLIKNHFSCFLATLLPYVFIISLALINYFIYVNLKMANFDNFTFISSYSQDAKAVILTLSVCLSYFVFSFLRFICEKYLFIKSRSANATLKQALKNIKLKQALTYITTEILKAYLCVAWSTVYFLPSAVMGFILYFFAEKLVGKVFLVVAFSTLALFVIGFCFLYITMKRYSFTSPIIFTSKEKDSLKIIGKSAHIAEGNTVKTTLFFASFIGWDLSCVFLLPLLYVLPYKKLSQFNYYNFLTEFKQVPTKEQKPIILHALKA